MEKEITRECYRASKVGITEKESEALFNFEGSKKKDFQKGKRKTRSREACGANGGVAQLGEHLPCKQGVRSSILLISTKGKGRPPWRTDRQERGL